ncbi:MAG: hypothetical protein DRP89_04540, partial [Candidatus Neomarinimicrobiota bacterium]
NVGNPNSVLIKVDDGNGGTVQKTYSISVSNTNDKPQIVAINNQSITEDSTFKDTVEVSDVDEGDSHIFSLIGTIPSGMVIGETSGIISWTPDNSQVSDNHIITVQVTDDSGATDTESFNLAVQNRPPEFSSTPVTETLEDEQFSYDVNSDDEGLGSTSYSLTKAPTWVFINSLTGIITGIPDNGNVGSDSIVVKVNDGNTDGLSYQRWELTVINVPPSITSEPETTATQEINYIYDLTSTDDGQGTVSYSATVKPDWLEIDTQQGILSGVPQNSDVGESSVIVVVEDGNGGTDSQSFTINVINTNDPPTIISSTITTAREDSLYLYDVNAQDPDNDTLVYSLETNPAGMTINSESGLIQWIPDNSNVGVLISVTVKVDDGNDENAIQSWTIDVSNTNPEITNTPSMLFADEDENFSFDINADDEGQGTTEYSIIHAPTWLVLENSSTGQIGGVPSNSNISTGDTLWVKFSDGNGGVDTLKTTLVVRNASPLFFSQQDTVALEDLLFTLDLRCDDEGYGDITYSAITSLPSWLSLTNSNGILNGTPLNENVETFSLSIKVDDGNSGYDTLDFNITVNNTPPNFIGSPISSVYEDSLYSYDLNVDDESSGLVTYSLITNPGWLSVNSSNGLLTGTPLNNHVGGNNIKIMADDGHNGADTLEFIISVINTPPQITTSPPNTAQEDIRYSIDFNCTDEGQGPMIYSALKKPSWLSINQGTGLLTGIPLNSDVTNEDSIKIMVSDGRGGYDTLAYTISVSNNAPHITSIFQDTTINEDESFSFDINSDDEGQGEIEYTFISDVPSWISIDTLIGVIQGIPLNNNVVDSLAIQVSVDDGNGGVDFGVFYITVLNEPPNFISVIDSIATENVSFTYDADTDDEGLGNTLYSLIGSYPSWMLFDDSTGILYGTPANDDVDTSLITIRFSDGNGSTVEQVFHLIVENANDSPYIITEVSQDTSFEDILWEMTFTAGDSDLVHGDSLQFLLADNPLGMSIDPDSGKVTWTPDNSFVGDNSFYVIVEDFALTRDSLYFTLHVNNVNDAPVLDKGVFVAEIFEDSLWVFQFHAQDDDSAYGEKLTYVLGDSPLGMTIVDSTGLVQWTPLNENIGQDSFMVYVRDKSLETDSLKFYLEINNTNDPPIINKDIFAAEIYEDSLWTFQFYALDDDSSYGEELTFGLNNNPLNMTIIDTTGFVQWTPLNENVGQDSFVVYVQDRSLATDSLKFYLTIINTNDPPQIAAIQDTIAYEDSLFRLTVQYTDVDVGDSARFSLVISPDSMAIDSLFGIIKWTPLNDDRDSNFVVTVCVKDGAGATDSVTFNIFVNDVNDPPILSDLNIIEFNEDSSYIMQYSVWFDNVMDIDDADSILTWEILPF